MPDLIAERKIGGRVAGVDEAGRGPLAGPVVAAAVLFDPARMPAGLIEALDDSKKLTPRVREELFDALQGCAAIGVAVAGPGEIDRINILQATLACMSNAVAALPDAPDHVLVDGNRLPTLACPARAIVGGDGISATIAAASIVAKVTRDRIMRDLARLHPGYGWESNVGYGTAAHVAALDELGPTAHHRHSFAPVRAALERLAGRPARMAPQGRPSTES